MAKIGGMGKDELITLFSKQTKDLSFTDFKDFFYVGGAYRGCEGYIASSDGQRVFFFSTKGLDTSIVYQSVDYVGQAPLEAETLGQSFSFYYPAEKAVKELIEALTVISDEYWERAYRMTWSGRKH